MRQVLHDMNESAEENNRRWEEKMNRELWELTVMHKEDCRRLLQEEAEEEFGSAWKELKDNMKKHLEAVIRQNEAMMQTQKEESERLMKEIKESAKAHEEEIAHLKREMNESEQKREDEFQQMCRFMAELQISQRKAQQKATPASQRQTANRCLIM